MSEITGPARVHEAYAFACMRCGHGWEQSYEIEHHVDSHGQEFIVYKTDGERVPSPLSSPTCLNCESHVVRIMRSGQVSSVLDSMTRAAQQPAPKAATPEAATSGAATPEAPEPVAAAAAPEAEPHHWHLSDLRRSFHRK